MKEIIYLDAATGKETVLASKSKEAQRGLRRHQLLTAPDRKPLIKQSQDQESELWQKQVITKFFCPYSYWTWYAVEFDGEDTFYGYVMGHENEWGSFSYGELQETTVMLGRYKVPGIERDCSFEPMPVRDLVAKVEAGIHV